MTTTELLTADELRAMQLTADLVNTLAVIVGDGPTRQGDMVEIVNHIHALQHTIMSQAAARAYPDQLRLLGQTITAPRCCDHDDDAHDGAGCLGCPCRERPGSLHYNPTPRS